MAPRFHTFLSLVFLILTAPSFATWGAAKAPCKYLLEMAGVDSMPTDITKGMDSALKLMLANVDPQIDPQSSEIGNHVGAVVAGGRLDKPNMQDYQYYWIRDGGITTTILVDIYQDSKSNEVKTTILRKLIRYLEGVKRLQDQSNLSGAAEVSYDQQSGSVIDYFLNMGEPKFHLTLANFEGDWGRSQTDGPPFSLKGIIRVSKVLWNDWDTLFAPGSPFKTSLKKTDLYAPIGINGSIEEVNNIIKRHLQYSFHNWRRKTVEMWEMMRGNHFATIGAHQAVLLEEGPDFAEFAGDKNAGTAYKKQGGRIDRSLMQFWDGKIIHATRDFDTGQFLDLKPEGKTDGLDTAVLIGAMHMKSTVFTPASDYLISTVYEMEQKFKTAYFLNQGDEQTAVLWGRYAQDSYDGYLPGFGTGKGNPWFLCSYYVAEHAYKTAQEIFGRGEININTLNVNFFNSTLKSARFAERVQVGKQISKGDPRFNSLITSLIKRGDNLITRLESFRGPNGEMSEQIYRDADSESYQFQRSIPNLTWSYAAYFRALKARRNFINSVSTERVYLNANL